MGIKDFFAKQKEKAAQEQAAREQRQAAERERKAEEQRMLNEKTAATEKELRTRMSASPILDMIINELTKEAWAWNRQGVEDDGVRTVALTADIFEVKWSYGRMEQRFLGSNKLGLPIVEEEWVEDVYERVAYSYTKSGYAPLTSFTGQVVIPLERVIQLWGEEVQGRIRKQIPNCYFNKTEKPGFTYKLPEPNRSLF